MNETTKLRVQKRWVGGQGGHYVYVLQQWVQLDFSEDGYWNDVPVVDEDERRDSYE